MEMRIIPKSEWGGRPATNSGTPVVWGSRGVVHHTADFSGDEYSTKRPGLKWFGAKYRNNRQVKKIMKAYQNRLGNVSALERANMRFMQGYHMAKGWADLGYHYVIYPSGNVYAGRAANTQGAHALNGNGMPGISFAMNSELEVATIPALESFDMLCHELGLTSVIGHRWVPGNSTACPGKNLIKQLHIDTTTGIARV